MTMIIANGQRVPLPAYTVLELTVAGVPRLNQFFVVPGRTSYSMNLGRPWLRDVAEIGHYEFDGYWIKGKDGNYNQLEVLGLGPNSTTEVFMGEYVLADTLDVDHYNIDGEILLDMAYTEDERANAILQEIEQEA